MMSQSTTMARENSELFDWENVDGHENILTFNEKDFEYSEGITRESSSDKGFKEPAKPAKESQITYKFEEQVMNMGLSDEPEEPSRVEKGKGFQYVESSDYEDDLDFDDEDFYSGGLEYN